MTSLPEGPLRGAPRGAPGVRRPGPPCVRVPAVPLLAVLLLAALLPAAARAQEADVPPAPGLPGEMQTAPFASRWSVGITAGTYSPRMAQLNHALKTPGLVILQDPNFLIPRNQDLPATTRDVGMPELTSTLSYGVELQWQVRERLGIVLMLLNWQGRSEIHDTITMNLRSNLPPVDVPRSARYNLNLNQFWLGWRYSLFDRPGQGRLFVNIGVAGLAVADLTMDALLKVNPGPDDPLDISFASISSTEVHGTAYSSRYGVGGEFFVTRKISVGFQANYIFGEFTTFRVSRYFPSGFSELPPVPPETTNSLPDNVLPSNHALPVVGEPLQTATITEPRETVEVVQNPQNVHLDLRGIEMSAMIRVYY